eukprot:TRINITY_DN67746_c6_g1_i1.p1 TRINITY_DN67746_c6_g1~~TRINITY_DN67746_c6_g1_i1.p1  ORF type:complete len:136 (-),score=22.24 TRINITY_DN67746_c6_g1_i1:174-554(-)
MSRRSPGRNARPQVLPGDADRQRIKEDLKKMMAADDRAYQKFMKRMQASSRSRSRSPRRPRVEEPEDDTLNQLKQQQIEQQAEAARRDARMEELRQQMERIRSEEAAIQSERAKTGLGAAHPTPSP